MSTISDKQLAANQQNAFKGGPKTPEGKAVVAQNAVKHGIFVKDVIVNTGLVQESPEEFDSLRESFFEALAPQGKAQEELVQSIVFNVWRKRRLMRAEAGEIKKANAYLADFEEANRIHNDESNEILSLVYSPEALMKHKLNNSFQIKLLVDAMESACYEYEDNGFLSENSRKSLFGLFSGDSSFCVSLHFTRSKASSETEKATMLLSLKSKLSKLRERQEYLENRDSNQNKYSSEANFVPAPKTVDKFLKYCVAIDKQIKNDLNLLRVLQGKPATEEKEDLAFNS